jgi:hypothetical protein
MPTFKPSRLSLPNRKELEWRGRGGLTGEEGTPPCLPFSATRAQHDKKTSAMWKLSVLTLSMTVHVVEVVLLSSAACLAPRRR